MLRIAHVCVALLFASAACGDGADGDPSAEPSGSDAGNALGGDSAAETDGANGQATTDAAVPQDTGSSAPDAAGSKPDSDAGGSKPDARVPLVLEIPKADMTCGKSSCDLLANVCCESWSVGKGFPDDRSCITREKCLDEFERVGDQNRAVTHECDGKEDCSGGLACCLVAEGAPNCAFDDIAMCTSKVIGPGGGGVCADATQCVLGSTRFIAPGVPLGILACNDDSDCEDRPETRCQPEQDNSLSTGVGVKARSYVKVCR